MLSTKRIFFANFLVLNVLSFIALGQIPNQSDISPLPINKTVEREIKAAEKHFFSIKLKAGEVLCLELEEGTNVNYVFRLIKESDGQAIIDSDLTNIFGREEITYIASEKEALKVLVEAPEKGNSSARYKLTAIVKNKATEADIERIRAEVLSREASKLSKDALKLFPVENRKESYQKASKLTEEALVLYRKQADKYWEAWTLNVLGSRYNSLGDKQKALDYYNQALVAIKLSNNKPVEAIILNSIGRIYESLNEYKKAADCYRQAFLIFKTNGNKDREAQTLMLLARVYYAFLKEPVKALENYNQALEIFRNINQKKEQASALISIGAIYNFDFKDNEKARDYYNQALSIYRNIGDKTAEAQILQSIGYSYRNSSDYQKQLEYYNQALSFYRELGDKSREAFLLELLGDYFYKYENKNQKWFDYYNQALAIYKSTSSKSSEVKSLEAIGYKFLNLGDYQKALEYYNQALSIFELESKTDNQSLSANSKLLILHGIAELYRKLGDEKKRLKYSNLAALSFSSTSNNKSSEPTSLSYRAIYAEQQKDFQKALELNNQELSIYREAGDKENEIRKLMVISRIYLELGDKQKMLDYENQALALLKNFNNDKVKISIFSDIAINKKKLGDNQKALEFYNQALSLSKSVVGFGGFDLSFLLSGIGQLYETLEEKQKAIEYYNQAISAYKTFGYKVGEGKLLESIGNIYLKSKDYQKAIDSFNEALQLYRTTGSKEEEANALSNNMSVWQLQGNNQLAILDGKQSVNIYQGLRQSTKEFDKETKESYSKKIEPTYRKLADILLFEGRFPEAQAVLDLLKEEEFGKIVQRSGESLFTVPYSRAEEAAVKIVNQLPALGRELSDLKAKPKESLSATESKRLNELEFTEIPAANKEFSQADDALSTVAPDVKNTLDMKMKDNIQNILPALGKGVVALYTVIGKTTADDSAKDKTASNKINVGWILLVTPEFRKAYPIDITDFEQTVFKFRESLRSPAYDAQPVAQELYKKLFLQTSDKQKTTLAADLETYLGKQKDKTLMWSLDGVLRYVPISALHDGKQYLVEKYRNVVFNTASLGSLKDAAKPNWEVVGLGISTEGTVKSSDGRSLRFSALKGSEVELNSLIKEKDAKDTEGIFSGTLKINNEFTKEALFEGARAGMPVMHVSTHFYFNPAQEETSFLLLGNGGKLEMTEFQDYPNLFSNVDFLSLSACDTATGSATTEKTDSKETNGKEVEGFAYLAQTLGAKSVMASLWQVSDTGTKELMLKFYKIKKEQPEMPKGEALRQAQLSLLRGTNNEQKGESGQKGLVESVKEEKKTAEGSKVFEKDEKVPFAHPYYWSSFILIGNWR